jgi:hypothetical protein
LRGERRRAIIRGYDLMEMTHLLRRKRPETK